MVIDSSQLLLLNVVYEAVYAKTRVGRRYDKTNVKEADIVNC